MSVFVTECIIVSMSNACKAAPNCLLSAIRITHRGEIMYLENWNPFAVRCKNWL